MTGMFKRAIGSVVRDFYKTSAMTDLPSPGGKDAISSNSDSPNAGMLLQVGCPTQRRPVKHSPNIVNTSVLFIGASPFEHRKSDCWCSRCEVSRA